MRTSKFSETQIVAILKEADAGMKIKELCRKHGISDATYYKWKSKFGGMDASDLKRVRELEAENAKLSELVSGRPSRGFWKCRKMIRRQGHPWNHKRIYRVYRLMELNLRRRAKRRVPKRIRVPLYVPALPDTVWSADFVSDALSNGRRFRTFNIVDDFNREALHIEIDTSLTSARLVRGFDQLREQHGLPQVLRTDNGPEFLGEVFTAWAKEAGMAIQYIQPGKPNQNAYVERFNRTYREELLDQYLFSSLDDVREATYWWMLEYNEERPHDSLGDRTPAEARNEAINSTFKLSA